MSVAVAKAVEAFESVFHQEPTLAVRAPGRVNIIGEHTDYNHGFVLPMAIEREIVIVGRPRDDAELHAYAANLRDTKILSLDDRRRNQDAPWLDYITGVVDEFARLGRRPERGANLAILGDVPLASGLSSSAALEMAALRFFEALGGFELTGPEAAQLGKRVENDFLGLSSGIMDQFISRCGKRDHALFLDCRSLEFELVPVAFPDAVFVIANTNCARGLTASKYNERVEECQRAVAVLQRALGGEGTHLRDYTLDDLERARAAMDDTAYRRARHVITENARTELACEVMRAGDVVALGKLMNDSDASLREDYEVTSAELDAMSSIARRLDGCYGARMTGAGFGGCTINLVDTAHLDAFTAGLAEAYHAETGLQGEILVSRPAEGASLLKV